MPLDHVHQAIDDAVLRAPSGGGFDGRLGILASGSYQRRKDRLNQAQTDSWIVNGGTPAAQINGGAGVAATASNPQANLFVPQNFDTKVTFEDRKRVGGTLVLQYKANDDLTITADTLYSRFTNTTDARSFGHWFTPSNLTDVVTDANGTAIDLTQGVGMASDFHDKAFDKKTRLTATGLSAEWKLSDRMTLNLDGSISRAKQDPNGGAESELALLGYTGQTIRYRSDGAILPKKDTALYSNDGGTGCATCGYNNAAPAGVPIGVFNAGSGLLSGISGADRLTTQWLTFDGQSLFNAITREQQAVTPGFTFAPPRVNDSVVEEQVYGGYLQAVFAGALGGRSFSNFIVLNQTTGVVNNSSGAPLLDPATGLPAQFTITAPTNGESAQVYGLEAGIQQSFGDSGFGIQLNGTLAHSDKDLDPQDLTNKFALTGLSNSANGVLFYDDKSHFEARMALNWREDFLQYLSPPPLNGAGQAVTQVRGRYQLDASATYHINKSFGVFVEGVNLTNRPVLKYAYYENQFLYAEDSGRRYKIGVRAQF